MKFGNVSIAPGTYLTKKDFYDLFSGKMRGYSIDEAWKKYSKKRPKIKKEAEKPKEASE